MVTACWIASIMAGSLMRATPPSRRMSAGTRSSAITATAPASSAIFACSGVTTSMITPPRNISASPRLTRAVPVVRSVMSLRLPARSPAPPLLLLGRGGRGGHRRDGARGGGRLGHVDRAACGQQLHPGATRAQRDRVPGCVEVLRGLRLVGAYPPSGAQRAVGEDPDVALADGLRLTFARVLRELDDDVRGRDVPVAGDGLRLASDR